MFPKSWCIWFVYLNLTWGSQPRPRPVLQTIPIRRFQVREQSATRCPKTKMFPTENVMFSRNQRANQCWTNMTAYPFMFQQQETIFQITHWNAYKWVYCCNGSWFKHHMPITSGTKESFQTEPHPVPVAYHGRPAGKQTVATQASCQRKYKQHKLLVCCDSANIAFGVSGRHPGNGASW